QTNSASRATQTKFQVACRRMVSAVDPLRQRMTPNRRPPQNTWAMTATLYRRWKDAQISEVRTIVPPNPSRDSLKPRNMKPRNASSSMTGATATNTNQKNNSPVTLSADSRYSGIIVADWSNDGNSEVIRPTK